ELPSVFDVIWNDACIRRRPPVRTRRRGRQAETLGRIASDKRSASVPVQRVDELAEAAVVDAVEVQCDARQVDVVPAGALLRQRVGAVDVAMGADVGELAVEEGEL